MTSTSRSSVIGLRVSSEKRANFATLAAHHRLTESGLLCRLVDEVLRSNTPARSAAAVDPKACDGHVDLLTEDRITLRLRPGDRTLAAERAGARGMKTGTYLTLLIHNHLRESDVLPPKELDLVKATGARLAALGRQLRMFDMPNTLTEPAHSELCDLVGRLRHEVEGAREASAAVVRRNLTSWEAGDA